MKFEELVNELLLDIFEFIDIIRLLRAFYGLNSRLNNLVSKSIRIYHVDFRSLPRQEFDDFCQRYLPSMINGVQSICLSDDDETPNLSQNFLSYDFNLTQFIHLQSLSFYSIDSINLINRIVFQCLNLTHFKMINCCTDTKRIMSSSRPISIALYNSLGIDDARRNSVQLMKNIWSLPKLINCSLIFYFGETRSASVVSSSIKYLYIESINSIYELDWLFQCTPHLQQFHTKFECINEIVQMRISASSLVSLKVQWEGSLNSLKHLLSQAKNLRYLIIDTSTIYLNGYEWEQILVEYLSQIKVFRFKNEYQIFIFD